MNSAIPPIGYTSSLATELSHYESPGPAFEFPKATTEFLVRDE